MQMIKNQARTSSENKFPAPIASHPDCKELYLPYRLKSGRGQPRSKPRAGLVVCQRTRQHRIGIWNWEFSSSAPLISSIQSRSQRELPVRETLEKCVCCFVSSIATSADLEIFSLWPGGPLVLFPNFSSVAVEGTGQNTFLHQSRFEADGSRIQWSLDQIAKSASLPGSSEPTYLSMRNCLAGFRVTNLSASLLRFHRI